MSNAAFLRGVLEHERDIFGKVARAVLDDQADYRPDPKSRSSRELIEHLIGHNLDLVELIDDGVINHRIQVPFGSIEEGAKQLDESFDSLIAKLGSVDEAQWAEQGKFCVGDQVIMEAPTQQLAWMLFLDSIHHRGQLSTHLRVTGSKVPAMYGPSADEQPQAH